MFSEPDDPSCNPAVQWLVRSRHYELSKEYDIQIRCWTHDRKRRNNRSDFGKILRELNGYGARLPTNRTLNSQFVQSLVQAAPKDAFEIVSKPGFRDGATGVVMPTRMYGSAKARYLWDDEFSDPAFGQIKGDLAHCTEGVLVPALSSPFVSFAVLIALAPSLASYTEQKDGKGKPVSEGAIFHWAAESSSGKTTLARITQSVFGSPDITVDYEASKRGVAEAAYARNDLVIALDDTENGNFSSDHELLKVMKSFAQRIASGRSKAIAKAAGKGAFPPLAWFCFAVSTGPETLAEIAARIGSKRFGERIRFFDIALPSGTQGGIFGAALGGARQKFESPAKLIDKIECAISKNHGVLFDAWVKFLLSTDQSARVRSLVDEFVDMTAGGECGLETRIARKFGVLYAAGLIAVDAGLLPWSADWVRTAVRYCYDAARNIRDPGAATIEAGLKAIGQALKTRKRFPLHDSAKRTTPLLPDAALGLRVIKDGKSSFYFCPDRLGLIGVKDPRLIMEKAKELGLVIASKNETPSVQIRVKTPTGQSRNCVFGDCVATEHWSGSNNARRR